ncbi:5-oxoprolinase subunit PxpB [Sinorhizobium americanum]|uniref:KipI family sensor histidine kinase inhibitor n=1 Tax=Sinorhizobium americanum TaxID=194963 RepID=A0A4R2C1L0_9HYPH|nr:5-oxoprolinase subunit PxpB [Sinorhizobium americanum]TCN33322.1 KipI family sensor histidine kinase inhibitor [Sinorhizobium americanum]
MISIQNEPISTPAFIAAVTAGEPKISVIGTGAYLIEAPGAFDLEAQRRIWALAHAVEPWPEVREVVPGVTNLLVILKRTPVEPEQFEARLRTEWNCSRAIDLVGKTVEIPVTYGGEHATDLAAVCDYTGLTDRQVVQLHWQGDYTVVALGSAPGFGYLHGLDPRIHVPRKTVPSLRMLKGTVTIGGMQTGVSVLTGPNGWNSIGFAELPMFDPMKNPPALLAPGDKVRFVPERIEL